MQTEELRNADLSTFVDVLRSEQARRYDVVVPAQGLTMTDVGHVLVAHDVDAQITEEGVTAPYTELLRLTPTTVASEHLSERLGIPRRYYARCETEAPPLLARQVNHWLQADDRSFYVRTFMGADDTPGILRSVSSDRFRPFDDMDMTMACLQGISESGVVDPNSLEINIDRSMRRMYMRIVAPTVGLDVPDLVGHYRDPRTNRHGRDFGIVNAQITIKNSEVGEGASVVVPGLNLLVCKNGMTRVVDSVRSVHVGGKHEEGVVDWSDDTQQKTLAVVTAKVRDAVRTFLSPEYLASLVAELRKVAGKPISDPIKAIENVTKQFKFSEVEQAGILSAFIKGGDLTAFGVAQAMTSYAQDAAVTADRRSEFEDSAWDAMTLAVA